jgi:hypothetical protein
MAADGTLADGWKRWALDRNVSLLAVLREAERRRDLAAAPQVSPDVTPEAKTAPRSPHAA